MAPERTALSWARTWALVGAVVLLLVRALLEVSAVAAAAVGAAGVVPLVGLGLTRRRHAAAIARFAGDGGQRARWRAALLLSATTVVTALVGAAVVLARAGR